MRDNRINQVLATGGIAVGTMNLEFSSSGVGRILAEAGADFCIFDMEHSGWGFETIRNAIATTRCTEVVPFVRVPSVRYDAISRALDVGAMGLVLPLVNDAEQARIAVESALYPPLGKRGCCFALAHDDYRWSDLAATMAHANENVAIIAQIETAVGLDNIEAIAATPGLSALWMGQFDLSASLGIPGQFDHPKMQAASERLLAVCRVNGLAAVLASTDPAELATGPTRGYSILVYLADLWIYQKALKAGFGAIRGHAIPVA